MQVLYERCAAVDVGKDVIAVAVRLPGDGPGSRQTVKRTFKTFYGVLGEAARWLTSLGVTHVAMEATGIYSMPVYHALIEHGDFAQVAGDATPAHVKNAPGPQNRCWRTLRGWRSCSSAGCCAGRFIPPAELKEVRDLTRYRMLCRCRHSIRYAEARIMPSSRARCTLRGVAAVKTSA